MLKLLWRKAAVTANLRQGREPGADYKQGTCLNGLSSKCLYFLARDLKHGSAAKWFAGLCGRVLFVLFSQVVPSCTM